MEKTVLVTYVSIHGSTQEVAEVLAAALREHGVIVDLQPARSVRSLVGYSAVVLGAPLYMFRLHRDALRFLSKHRSAFINGLPVAVFAGGPFGETGEKEWKQVSDQVDKELAKLTWLKPTSVELIGGKFDPARLRFPWNLIPALKQMPASDLRDWTAIRDWAADLVVKFSMSVQDRQPVA